MTVYDWIEGNCDPHEIITLEEAEPIIKTEVDFAINEIEYQTGVQYDKKDFMSRLTDKEWIFRINNNDEPDEIDMFEAEAEIEYLTNLIILEIRDEQEEEE